MVCFTKMSLFWRLLYYYCYLTHDGTYGEFMKSDLKEDLKLKRCFQSFYQVYSEGQFITQSY